MAVTMVREAWTDEHLDDLKEHMDARFGEVVAEQRALRANLHSLQSEVGRMREGQGEVRAEIKGINRTLQVGFGLIGSFLGVLAILIATQL